MGEKLGPQFQAAGVIHGEHFHGGAACGYPPDTHAVKQRLSARRRTRSRVAASIARVDSNPGVAGP